MPNLLQLAQGRDIPFTEGLIEAVQKDAPALMAIDARTSTSSKFVSLALTALPTASGFKNYGEGATHGDASLALREFEAKLVIAKVLSEMITAARWDAEHGYTGTTWHDLQVQARIAAELRNIERVLFYGTVQDAKGFPGMKELTPFTSANLLTLTEDPGATDYGKSVLNATGSTSSTASSVYSIIEGPLNAQLIVVNDGAGGEFFHQSEPIRQHIAPDAGSPDATLEYLVQQIWGHFGLSVSGMNQAPGGSVPTQYSVRRLANLTEDSGKGVDDGKLEQLTNSHGDGKTPTRIFMNHRSGRQWADSRSATAVTLFLGGSGDAKNNTGSVRAKRPDNFEGIPVTYTSAIRSNDAIETV